VAELLDVVGQIRLTSGDYPQGLEYFKRSLQLYSKLLGENSRPVGELQNNLGVAYAWVGDVSMAVAMQKQAIATYRKVFGETHQEIVPLMYNLTVNLHFLGSHEEEASIQHELARIAAETTGLADQEVLSVKQAGYAVLYDRGQYKLAEQGIRDAIDQHRRLGDSPRFLAGTYSTLGDALVSQGRLAEAVEAYQTGANQFHEKDQSTNQAARIYERLGYGLALQGRNAQAREVLQKSISGFRSRGPLYTPLASALLTMGRVEMAEHHRPEASQLIEQALAIRKKVMIPTAWEVTVAEATLARSRDDVSRAPALTSALERCASRSYECQMELARLRAVLGQRR
jgi:tetratricopeptide (TPR) repeat protein